MSTSGKAAVILVALAIKLLGLYLLWHWFGWHAVAVAALLFIKIDTD